MPKKTSPSYDVLSEKLPAIMVLMMTKLGLDELTITKAEVERCAQDAKSITFRFVGDVLHLELMDTEEAISRAQREWAETN